MPQLCVIHTIIQLKGETMLNLELKKEILIATMFQKDFSLIEKMNVKTDAIICNQTDHYAYDQVIQNNNTYKLFNFHEKGVGLNRNNALMRSKADVCILADDDMVFYDDYASKVESWFQKYPNADVLIFNIDEENSKRYKIVKPFKVNKFNYMRFGAARIVFKRESVTRKGIFFNLHFGGGTEHSAGEDVLFLNSCLKNNLIIMAVPDSIAKLVDDRPSTWFEGHTKKFFIDKGFLYEALSPKWAKLLSLQFCIRRYRLFKEEVTFKNALKWTNEGIKQSKKIGERS